MTMERIALINILWQQFFERFPNEEWLAAVRQVEKYVKEESMVEVKIGYPLLPKRRNSDETIEKDQRMNTYMAETHIVFDNRSSWYERIS